MSKKLIRTCIGCRNKKEKNQLIRIVRKVDNEICVDLKHNIEGRGAYICNDKDCFCSMQKKNRLKSALKTNVNDKKYEELRGVIFGGK